jgi:hypothetical protein
LKRSCDPNWFLRKDNSPLTRLHQPDGSVAELARELAQFSRLCSEKGDDANEHKSNK